MLLIFQAGNALIAQELYFRHFDVKDGLASSTVYNTLQDSKGFIWFGTDAGVSRYNGYLFENFATKDGLSDNEVFEVFEDSKQRIWFRTFNGKISYFYKNRFYNSSNTPFLKQLDSPSSFTSIMEDKLGNIWLGTEKNGILCLENTQQVKRYLTGAEESKILYLYQCEHDEIIAVVAQKGIWDVLKNKLIKSYQEFRAVHEKTAVNKYKYIGNNNLLMLSDVALAGYKKKLYQYNCATHKVTTVNLADTIGRILSFSDGKKKDDFWINTTKGAYKWPDLTFSKYLKDKPVTWTMVDRENNTWITTLGKGIYSASALDIVCFNEKQGLPVAASYCLEKDSLNTLWIGHSQTYLSSINVSGKVSHYCIENLPAIPIQRTLDICITDSAIWLANDLGLLLFRKNKLQRYGWGGIKSITSSGGMLYIATAQGLLAGKEKDILQGRIIDYVQKDRLTKIFKDKNGKIWMGMVNEPKICSINDVTIDFEKSFPELKLHGRISDMEESPTEVWVSTQDNGLYAIKNHTDVVHFNELDGLSSSACNNLCIDSEDKLWIATNKGLDRLSTKNGKVIIENFDINDGLIDNEIKDVCIIGETVWLATTKGVSTFPKRYKREHFDIPIYITGFYVSGNRIEYKKSKNKLKYNENNIKIDFIGLSYKHQGKPLVYRYKVMKEDTTWHYTNNTSVEFPFLSSRQYDFNVQVQNNDGTWNNESAVVSFLIETPFWKSSLFFLLMGFLLASGLGLAIYLRIKIKRKKDRLVTQTMEAELKALRAQMEPHFFSNALNFLQSLLKKGKAEASEKYLLKFIQLIRSTLYNSTSEFIPVGEEIKTLQNYLELYQMGETKFRYAIHIDIGIDQEYMLIPPMLAQPFIENSIKHGIYGMGEKGQIDIRYIFKKSFILLEVEDNGIGIQKSMEMNKRFNNSHRSYAIHNIQKRLDLFNRKMPHPFQLIIEEAKDEMGNSTGTRVSITMPYTIL